MHINWLASKKICVVGRYRAAESNRIMDAAYGWSCAFLGSNGQEGEVVSQLTGLRRAPPTRLVVELV
jgi:hypothetical protein